MKRLMPLFLLCLLLCGCGRQTLPDEAPAEPMESAAGSVTVPEEYGGTVRTVPLNLRTVRGLRVFNGNILLLSGCDATELVLLEGENQQELARLILEFPLEQEGITLHTGGILSFFDPVARETLVLDSRLKEIRRIPAPDALSGTPILSDDGKILYYCTASHVRAWDLETGIRRCVKEMAFPGQRLQAVLPEGNILQVETEEAETLFLYSEDGRLLYRGEGSYTVTQREGRYYATIPSGGYRLAVFGQEEPRLLFPQDPSAQLHYLPRHHGALTAVQTADCRVRLDHYSLSSGCRSGSLDLGAYQMPKSAECLDADTILLLTYDPDADRDILTFWEPGNTAPPSGTGYIHPYPTTDLTQCRRHAEALEQRFGIRILIGEEAADAAPRDYRFSPETLAPVVQQELALLEQRLSHFPETVLQQTAAHFSSLNLCLIRSLERLGDSHPEASAGVQYLSGTDAYIAFTQGPLSEQTLYHELFHLMEIHIFSESKALDQWNSLNPAGFSYDYDYAANTVRDSGVYLFEEHRAFVDTYAMSFPREDRARILEHAMLPGQEALFRPTAMQRKLRTLCQGIRDSYALKGHPETFLWEQYLQ